MLQAAARLEVLRVLAPLEAQREVGGVGGIERRVLSLGLLAPSPTRVSGECEHSSGHEW